jgi:hypothetical protein
MKTATKRAGAKRKDGPEQGAADDTRRRSDSDIAGTVRQWAKKNVKKSPVDSDEGGSGQP